MRDKTLITASGETISYSTLIIATGARVRLFLQEISYEKSDTVLFFILSWNVLDLSD